jgi:GT2 family glycosyltransferase
LNAQSLDRAAYNIVIVDDGSTEPISDRDFATTAADLILIRQPPLGPAAARNRGVLAAKGDIIVFIGDDIMVPPEFLETHYRWHHTRDKDFEAALGKVVFPSSYLDNPHMRWLDQSGVQFGYSGLAPGQILQYFHFYTSNISLKKTLLLRHNFDERFSTAAYEDTDLGLRLHKAGLCLYYEPRAFATHHHFYDIETTCAHFRQIGSAACLFEAKHSKEANFKWIRRPPLPKRVLCGSDMYRRLALFAAESGDPSPISHYYFTRVSQAFWEGYFERRKQFETAG